jgi:hypothetical protein
MREEDKNRVDEGRGDGGPASNDAPLPAADATGGAGGLIVVSAEEIGAIGPRPMGDGGGGDSNERGRPPIQLKTWQVVAIVLLAAFTIFVTWRVKRLGKSVLSRTSASVMISKSAPDFTLPVLGGDTVSLADYRGKKTLVVSYWASWCGPCKVELPELREFTSGITKLTRISKFWRSASTNKKLTRKNMRLQKLPFPVLFDPQARPDLIRWKEFLPCL